MIRIKRQQVLRALCAFSSSPSCRDNNSGDHLLSGSVTIRTLMHFPLNLGSCKHHSLGFWQRSGH
jgi:hypothetical protein